MKYLLVLLLACLVLAGAYICYHIAFHSPHRGQNDVYNLPEGEQYAPYHARMREMIAHLSAVPCEEVSIVSRDGLRLSARYYHRADGAPLDICLHGYRGSAIRDFCGGAAFGRGEGHNVLLVDQRAHGRSEGRTITFGIRERYDCLDWIAWANARLGADTHILLYGISMGAATVLMAAGLPLPANVRGIIADCPYSSPREIIRKVMRDNHLPVLLLYPLVVLGARLFGRFRLGEVTAAEAVRAARVPILIIHGEDDRFVPARMSAEIQAANPEMVARQTFPRAAHGMSYMEDEPRYVGLVREFMRRV